MNLSFIPMLVARGRRAFTLLEVMIGVLILALALLGMGAVIPVVVRTQKLAIDATNAVTAANSVQIYLNNREDLNRLRPPVGPGNGRMGWGVWLLDQNWSPATAPLGPGPAADAYLWEPLRTTGNGREIDPTTGEFRLEPTTGSPQVPVIMSVADRLFPARLSDGADPVFIWDVLGRRMQVPEGMPARLQIALFVRRLDLNIRVPGGTVPGTNPARPWSVYDVVTRHPNLPGGAARLPLAVSNTGLPTNNGVGEYAVPVLLDVALFPARRDRLRLLGTSGTQVERDLARQIGQKWVDNFGNVYTVQGNDESDTNGERVLISPPVPSWVPDPSASGVNVESTLRQIAFTPQIPASVSVFTVTPLDPK